MAAGGAFARAKGVLLALMEQAYRRRERVALLSFAGARVELRLPPRKASAWNDDWIAPIGAGGGTPLGPAIAQAAQLLARDGGEGWLWLLTDGRSRDRPERPAEAAQLRVIDFEQGRVRLGRAQALAQAWGAEYLPAEAWARAGSAPQRVFPK
ncbi:hypothetical protein GCM10007320_64330 [Pseudorhodoferax aquiterrae]|uniref:VWFA domain-containing protein n=2 Tax=Pseudorhodoferax aquiterrae TaxID=747304 RepID=A0ABQ3GET4_9BURK|nr:hypothetical protein GCM10007320_64330 [Pseudorhodoferax aquiterrae]